MTKTKEPELRDYQKKGIEIITSIFLVDEERAFLLADETGLGKTVQALKTLQNIMRHYKGRKFAKHALVVCPGFLRIKWRNEIIKWLPRKRSYGIAVKSFDEVRNVEILTYLTRYRYALLIVDEMHYCKGFESLRTQAVLGAPTMRHKTLLSVSKHILGLSATPMPQRVGELYPWLWTTKHPSVLNITYEQFLRKWAKKVRVGRFGITHKGVKNADELKAIVQGVMLRRKKHDVEKQLPPGTRDFIPVECSAAMYKEEQALMKEFLQKSGYKPAQIRLILSNPQFLTELLETMPSFEQLAIFKHQCGLFKIKPVFEHLKEYIKDCRAQGKPLKFVVATFHTDVAEKYGELLHKVLKKYKVPVTVVTGLIDSDKRFGIVNKADADEQHVLVASMHSVKEGLDLIGFNQVFFTEPDWAPYVLTQFEGRFLRIGQLHPVFWTYFLFNEGIERYIFQTLEEKFEVVEAVIG